MKIILDAEKFAWLKKGENVVVYKPLSHSKHKAQNRDTKEVLECECHQTFGGGNAMSSVIKIIPEELSKQDLRD